MHILVEWFKKFNKQFKYKDLITWKKQRGRGTRKGWLFAREEVMWFVKDNKKFIWNKKYQYSTEQYHESWQKRLGKKYKRATNVWTDIVEDTLKGACGQKDIKKKNFNHLCPKPVEAIERIIKAHTQETDVIFDCFVGTGTTALVAQQLNRQFIVGDNDEECIRITKKRLHGEEKN